MRWEFLLLSLAFSPSLFRSRSWKFTEFRLRDHLLLLMNDKNRCILFCKRAFSDVLEGVISKNFSGSKPPDPYFSVRNLWARTKYFWSIVQICNTKQLPVFNWTAKIFVPPPQIQFMLPTGLSKTVKFLLLFCTYILESGESLPFPPFVRDKGFAFY